MSSVRRGLSGGAPPACARTVTTPRLGLPVDAKPDADLARVFSAIASQAAEVSFDHMTLDWG